MSDLVQRVRRNLEAHRLPPRDGRLLVAVSGGLDSMVLLAVLRRLAVDHRLHLSVAHANHELRGVEADADEALVVAAAAEAGLPCRTGRLPVRETMSRNRESIEMAARRLRHRFLAVTARELGIRSIALAHHADDQAELVLLRLLRGAGGEGLGGMAWSDGSPADHSLRVIRPLLDVSRGDLEAFAKAEGVPFREDASNADRAILRNRVRHELLPLLEKEFNPALRQVLQRTAQVVGADADFVARSADRWRGAKRRAPFERLHMAVQRAVIRRQLWDLGHAADFARVERLRRSAGAVSAGAGLVLERGAAGIIRPRGRPPAATFRSGERQIALGSPASSFRWDGLIVRWKRGPAGEIPRRAAPGREQFDAESVGPDVVLRHWRPGDRFQPLGFARTAKLQDLFVNRKIPAARRRGLVVAATVAGGVFWVEGLPPGERYKVTSKTQRVLTWAWGRPG